MSIGQLFEKFCTSDELDSTATTCPLLQANGAEDISSSLAFPTSKGRDHIIRSYFDQDLEFVFDKSATMSPCGQSMLMTRSAD